MGGVSSKNTIENSVKSALVAMTDITQNCRGTLDNTISFDIVGGSGDVTISDSKFDQSASVDTKCLQNASISNELKQQIDQIASQTATSISQQLSLNPTGTDAENITKLSSDLFTGMYNTFTQDCITDITNKFAVKIRPSGDTKNITIDAIDVNQAITNLKACVQDAKSVNEAEVKLSQKVDQAAKAEMKNILDFLNGLLWLLLIPVIIIVLIVGVTGYGKMIMYVCIIIIALIVILGVVDIVFYFLDMGSSITDTKGLIIYIIWELVLGALLGYLIYKKYKESKTGGSKLDKLKQFMNGKQDGKEGGNGNMNQNIRSVMTQLGFPYDKMNNGNGGDMKSVMTQLGFPYGGKNNKQEGDNNDGGDEGDEGGDDDGEDDGEDDDQDGYNTRGTTHLNWQDPYARYIQPTQPTQQIQPQYYNTTMQPMPQPMVMMPQHTMMQPTMAIMPQPMMTMMPPPVSPPVLLPYYR